MIALPSERPGRRIDGTTSYLVGPHRPGHKIASDILANNAASAFGENYGAGYYGLVIWSDGSAQFAGEGPDTPAPPAEVMHWMLDLGRAMNEMLHEGGYWMLCWHREQRLGGLWMSPNGLVRCDWGIDMPFVRAQKLTQQEILQQIATAQHLTRETEREHGMHDLHQKLVPTAGAHGLLKPH